MKVKDIPEIVAVIKNRIDNPNEREMESRKYIALLDKCVSYIAEGKTDIEHSNEVFNEYIDLSIEAEEAWLKYICRPEAIDRNKVCEHYKGYENDIDGLAQHIRSYEISEQRLFELVLECDFYIGIKGVSAQLRGGSYIGGKTDYIDHRKDGFEKAIELMKEEFKMPRTEQLCHYGLEKWKGGRMFDTIVFEGTYGGYLFYFGYSTDKGAITMSEHDMCIEKYNREVMALL